MEGEYNPKMDYALYWGLVLDQLKQELAEYYIHIKHPDESEKYIYNPSIVRHGVIYFLPDQFLPPNANPELQDTHKTKMTAAVIFMGMNCWTAFQPSAMAFCVHLGAPLIEELRTEENQLRIKGYSESTSSVKIEFEWNHDPYSRTFLGIRKPRPENPENLEFIRMDE